MTTYQVYILGRDGRFVNVVELVCADDAAAIEAAKQVAGDYDVKLWQNARLVAQLRAATSRSSALS